MGNFKEELKEIIGNALLSFHGDPSQSGFLVQYGSEKHIISVAKILNDLNDEKELSIDRFLSLGCPFYTPSNILPIGEIRLMDPTFNVLGSFSIVKEEEQKHLFCRVFYDNLRMVDGDMPTLLEAAINFVKATGISKSNEILKSLIESNPLHINDEWKESTYRFKFGRLLYNFALGMTEKVVWHGHVPNGGILYFNGSTHEGFGFYDQPGIGDHLVASTKLLIDGTHCEFKLLEP